MIRKMMLEDLPIIWEMELRLFSSPWPRESYEYELTQNAYSHLFVAENDQGCIVGYAGVWTTFDQAQITTIGVDEPFRRQHWASRLMDQLIDTSIKEGCEILTLEVRVSNFPAQACYKKYGFEIVSIRKNYYQDNHEDAYLMMKPIGGNL